MYNKTLEEGLKEFEDRYCNFEISERISKIDMLNIKSFLTTFAEKIREGVVETILEIRPKDIEGEARYHGSYNDGKRDIADDLLAQLKNPQQ